MAIFCVFEAYTYCRT